MRLIGYMIADTARAVLFQDHFWSDYDWLPKSQITIKYDEDSHEIVIEASPWICSQKGIREFQYREVVNHAERE